MGLTLSLDAPLYEGTSTSTEVPGKFPCALAGRPYLIDTARDGDWRHESIEMIRQQADQSDAPGDQSLNPESLWRRTADDWSGGAGQRYRDRPDSSATRFRTSFGLDVWTEGEVSLLPATEEWEGSSDSNLFLAVAGARLYFTEGQATKYVTSLGGSVTTVTSTHASAVTGLASTGFRVLIGCSDGIYRTNTGTSAAEKWSSLVTSALAYVKGRVMAAGASASKHILYNVTDDMGGGAVPYAAPSALFTHPDSNFTWVGFAGGPTSQHIYAAGYSGDKSLVYKVPLKDDGTGLDAPIVAAELPDGEVVTGIASYLGFVLIGTDQGVRFATSGSGGDLTLGALLVTGSAVRCFEGQGPHVWFGWESYDPDLSGDGAGVGPFSGLGRLSLESFASTDNLAPAYATDLMSDGVGNVTAVTTFDDRRVFAVAGQGFFVEVDDGELVGFGVLTSGLIDYRLADAKVALFLTVHSDDGTIRAGLAVDGGAEVELATVSTSDERFLCGEARGRSFEWVLALFKDGSDDTAGPTVQSVVFESEPTARTVEWLFAPFLLHETLSVGDAEVSCSPRREREFVRSLRDSRELVTYQEASDRFSVVVSDFVWAPHDFTADGRDTEGTLLVKMKKVA